MNASLKTVLWAFFATALMITVTPAIAAGVATPGMECAQLKPGASLVEVEVFLPEPRFDAGFTGTEIMQGRAAANATAVATKDNLRSIWSQTDPETEVFSTLMWDIQTNFTMQSQPVDQFKTRFCPYIMEATIDILGLSMISVPKNSPPGTCHGEEIATHEYKHFEVNKYLLEQAVQKLRRDMPRIIRDLEMEGYVPEAEVQARMDAMKMAMTEAINTYLTEEVGRRMVAMNKLVQICEIKQAMAKGDKATAMKKMQAFKGEAPPAKE